MNNILLKPLCLLVILLFGLAANGENKYTVVYEYPNGSLLQIDKNSITSKYGYLMYDYEKDFEKVAYCAQGDRLCDLYKPYFRYDKPKRWYFANIKIKGEELRIVLCNEKYSFYDSKNNLVSAMFDIKNDSSAKIVQEYISTFKGRIKLKKLSKEALKND